MITIKQYTLPKQRSHFNLYAKYRHFIPKILRPCIESKIFSHSHPHPKKHNPDLYISLRNNCISAIILSLLNLRTFSFPFDWISGGPLNKNLDCILNEFKDFLNYQDLIYPSEPVAEGQHLHVHNVRTDTFFVHDFSNNTLPEFHSVEEKYKRRCNRLLHSCASKKILFLYTESNPDNTDYKKLAERSLEKLNLVKNKLHAKEIKLIILHSSNIESSEIETFQYNDSSIYIFGTKWAKPFPFKEHERFKFAFLVKEILQTIEADSERHFSSQSPNNHVELKTPTKPQ